MSTNGIGGNYDNQQQRIIYTPGGPKAIADAIRVSASLTRIDIKDNQIGPEGAKHIAEGIRVSASLTYLDTRLNRISGEGAVQLSAAVLGNTKIENFNAIPVEELRADSLTELKLESKVIGIDGAMVVAGFMPVSASLTSINLGYNELGLEGAKYIAEGISVSASLTSINLMGN